MYLATQLEPGPSRDLRYTTVTVGAAVLSAIIGITQLTRESELESSFHQWQLGHERPNRDIRLGLPSIAPTADGAMLTWGGQFF